MTNTQPQHAAASASSAHKGAASCRRRRRALAAGVLVAGVAAAALSSGPAALATSSPSPSPTTTAGKSASLAPTGQVKWSVTPSSASGPDQRLKFSYSSIKPGSTVTDHVIVANYSRQPVNFEIYATDATGTTQQNSLQLLPSAGKPTDIGSWVTFAKQHTRRLSVVIPSGQGVIEPFTIAVPRQATPGDHTGGLIASVTLPQKKASGAIVNQDVRIAVPLEMRVIGPLHAGLLVESISAGFNNTINPIGNGSSDVSFVLHNTGNVRLAGTQTAWVTGPLGMSAKVKLLAMPTVLPGDSVQITGKAAGLYPAGPLVAHVQVQPGAPKGEPALPQALGLASGTASLFAVPWAAIVVVVLVVCLVIGWWQLRRFRRRGLQEAINEMAETVRRETEQRLSGAGGTGTPSGQA